MQEFGRRLMWVFLLMILPLEIFREIFDFYISKFKSQWGQQTLLADGSFAVNPNQNLLLVLQIIQLVALPVIAIVLFFLLRQFLSRRFQDTNRSRANWRQIGLAVSVALGFVVSMAIGYLLTPSPEKMVSALFPQIAYPELGLAFQLSLLAVIFFTVMDGFKSLSRLQKLVVVLGIFAIWVVATRLLFSPIIWILGSPYEGMSGAPDVVAFYWQNGMFLPAFVSITWVLLACLIYENWGLAAAFSFVLFERVFMTFFYQAGWVLPNFHISFFSSLAYVCLVTLVLKRLAPAQSS